MKRYVILLRGINVGGNNTVPMAKLREGLEALGYAEVSTLLNSGNVILSSDKSPLAIKTEIEKMLVATFGLKLESNQILVVSQATLKAVINGKPAGFGDEPSKYHSDVIFLIGVKPAEAMKVFDPRDGVDVVSAGKEVIYSQRLSSQRTKSRLNKVMGSPLYRSMTIRTWKTMIKLYELLSES